MVDHPVFRSNTREQIHEWLWRSLSVGPRRYPCRGGGSAWAALRECPSRTLNRKSGSTQQPRCRRLVGCCQRPVQWWITTGREFKSCHGLSVTETSSELSSDATSSWGKSCARDSAARTLARNRFATTRCVNGERRVRFYEGCYFLHRWQLHTASGA